ncbi:LuxR C-terminal-related transcriptional regulator [Bradyrhizobium sp. Arg816]|uniref:LuxR C-terminal-related transcriptional regulator n=1 Tax=Bradyrhizobium sp. Arg816 TaxID=2998491 RepID=UPI00249F38A4|nr:LuxR C-terminal-related transcriptional regulator [Bradyrhizobium sp. Arg816]MDI3561903.1 LuxR C-terminal-related transcriptional regulator [Bradyrhizobium sp. Arg816]
MPLLQVRQTTGLRGARFAAPRAPANMVERVRLVARFDEGSPQVTLICAPAGFGKTTLMQQLRRRLQAQGVVTIWLQVEQADNRFDHFVQSLAGAVQAALGQPGANSSREVHATEASRTQGQAADVLASLSVSETPIVLLLDDLELIVDAAVWAFLERLLVELDLHHRVVFGSRTRPQLALGRIRAYGQLLELGQTDLRFTPEETTKYLERQNVGASSIRALQQHTEGWPAALQLAVAASSVKHMDVLQSVSGGSAAVADYLAQEVLDSRPASQRDFLLRSAELGQFCAELCDAALERNDSSAMISEIVRDNLLITPIDAEESWYRYHPLFADFLRVRMARERRDALQPLHRRAADWAAAHGLMNEAITHALAARDQALAADLLTASAMDSLHSGRVADTAHAIALLPDDEVYARPALLRAAAFSAIFAHRYDAARRYIEQIRRADAAGEGADEEIVAMHLMLLGWTDSIPDLLRAVEELRAGGAPFGGFTAGLASNARAFCNIALGNYVEAERDLAQAREACEPLDAFYVLSYSACFTAAIELNLGQVAAARATLEGAFNRAIAAGQRYGSSGAVIATYLAECLYEANELDACQALVDDYLPIVTETGLPDHLVVLHRIASRLQFLRGRSGSGHALLVQLGEIGARRGLRRLSAAAWLERSHASLRGKNVEEARRAFATGNVAFVWDSFGAFKPHASEIDDISIAALRLQLVTGEARHALPEICSERQLAENAGRRRRALRLLFLEAQALEASGHRREAGVAFDQAVMRAAEGGMVRVLADESWATEPLVSRSAIAKEPRAVSLLRDLKDFPATAEPNAHSDGSSDVAASALRLTTREVQILRLVWKGSPNKEIARLLFLTENTIETHLRRIYRKLGTRKRTQAAAMAREAGAI